MLGNITFIGELFKEDIVPAKIMMHCINHLMPGLQADEESMENLCKLLDTAGGKLEAGMSKNKDKVKQINAVFKKMQGISERKGLSSRIKFAIIDIIDMRSRNWRARTEKAGPKKIADVHAEAQQEQLKIQQQNKGGGHGGGHGGNRRDSRNSSYGSQQSYQQQTVQVQRRAEKVDASRFGKGLGGGGGSSLGGLGGLGGFKLGGRKSGGAPSGQVSGGRYVKKGGNSFAALSVSSKSKAGSGSPLLQPKKNSLMAKRNALRNKAESPVPASKEAAAPEKEAPPPCKLSAEELTNKTTGAINEYLSIKDIKEIKLSIEEWGHEDATHAFMGKILSLGLEAKPADQNTLQGLLFNLVGKEGGIPTAMFSAAVKDTIPMIDDLRCDIPNIHKYLAGFIAAAAASDAEACKCVLALKEPEVLEMLSDLGLKITLEVFSLTKKKKQDHIALYKSLELDLNELLPEDRRADGTLADLADRADVSDILGEAKTSEA